MSLERWYKQLVLSEEESEADGWLVELKLMIGAVVESGSGMEIDLYYLARDLEASPSTCRRILEEHPMVKIERGKKGKIYRSNAPPLLPTFDGLLAEAVLGSCAGSLSEQAREDFHETRRRGSEGRKRRAVEKY